MAPAGGRGGLLMDECGSWNVTDAWCGWTALSRLVILRSWEPDRLRGALGIDDEKNVALLLSLPLLLP